MKPTNFAYWLTRFLGTHLPAIVGASKNSILSYRDTFLLFLRYCAEEESIKAEKLTLELFTRDRAENFLLWLEEKRGSSVSTRNQRLAAIQAFCKYIQYEHPQALFGIQEILSIPAKKTRKKTPAYLSVEQVKALLAQPNRKTREGRRDLALLGLLYDTGARVQEIADLNVVDVRLQKPETVKLAGKGNKTRIVPLSSPLAGLLAAYMEENRLFEPVHKPHPLFTNRFGNRFSRFGIAFVLEKHRALAARNTPGFPEKLTPHMLRHSKAMHLLQSGVNLVYIRDILGHVSIQTTEVYARADSEMKRKAFEKARSAVESEEVPKWHNNPALLDWLQRLGK